MPGVSPLLEEDELKEGNGYLRLGNISGTGSNGRTSKGIFRQQSRRRRCTRLLQLAHNTNHENFLKVPPYGSFNTIIVVKAQILTLRGHALQSVLTGMLDVGSSPQPF